MTYPPLVRPSDATAPRKALGDRRAVHTNTRRNGLPRSRRPPAAGIVNVRRSASSASSRFGNARISARGAVDVAQVDPERLPGQRARGVHRVVPRADLAAQPLVERMQGLAEPAPGLTEAHADGEGQLVDLRAGGGASGHGWEHYGNISPPQAPACTAGGSLARGGGRRPRHRQRRRHDARATLRPGPTAGGARPRPGRSRAAPVAEGGAGVPCSGRDARREAGRHGRRGGLRRSLMQALLDPRWWRGLWRGAAIRAGTGGGPSPWAAGDDVRELRRVRPRRAAACRR